MMSEDVFPPLLLVQLLEVNKHYLLILWIQSMRLQLIQLRHTRTESPGAFIDLDVLAKLTGHDRVFALEADAELLLLDNDIKVSSARSLGHRDLNVDIPQLLLPGVGQC